MSPLPSCVSSLSWPLQAAGLRSCLHRFLHLLFCCACSCRCVFSRWSPCWSFCVRCLSPGSTPGRVFVSLANRPLPPLLPAPPTPAVCAGECCPHHILWHLSHHGGSARLEEVLVSLQARPKSLTEARVSVCVYMCEHVCACACTCVYMCVHVCSCVSMCVHVCVHVCRCAHVCMCVCLSCSCDALCVC